MFKISENANPNYLCKIVKLGTPIKHSNANALQGFIIDHNRTWTNMDYSEGDRVVYFPLECCINPELLSYLNLYQHSELNADKTKKSYFSDSGRVKAIRLRGEPSEGIVLPLNDVLQWAIEKQYCNEIYVPSQDVEFDSIGDAWDCKNNVPDEGVCIMNLSNRVWRKCKSWKFLHHESLELDKGNEVDLESQESQTE